MERSKKYIMDMLIDINHRPFPLASRRWILQQQWRNVSFLHWSISPKQLRPLIPRQLQIDTYQDQAWIGMIIFDMQAIFLRGLPFLSLTPIFSEINIRTYVSYQGVPGIYFLSIDVDNWASQTIARRWYRLPYRPARVFHKKVKDSYQFETKHNGQNQRQTAGSITPYPKVFIAERDSFDYWLTERYRLYSSNKNTVLFQSDIHHQPWKLQKAKTNIKNNTLLSEFNFDIHLNNPTVTHFSNGVDTLFWNIKRIQNS